MITRDGRLVRADVEVVEVSPPNGANTHAPYASGGRGAEGLFALFLAEVVRTPRHVSVGSNHIDRRESRELSCELRAAERKGVGVL